MTTIPQLIERVRVYEADHDPDGWPAIKMKEVTALADALEQQHDDIDAWRARAESANSDFVQLMHLLADIRTAAGDPRGKLMQPALVEHIRHMREDVDLLRRSYHNACEELSALKAALVEEDEAPPIGPALSLVERLKARQVVPQGMALGPRQITADTGHKARMIGEFSERISRSCPDCVSLGVQDDCEICDGTGEYTQPVFINWTNIKAIHRRIVEIAEETTQ